MTRTHTGKEAHRPRLTAEQKERRSQNHKDLTKAIVDATSNYQELAQQIASKHRRSIAWTKNQLFLGGKATKKTRTVNTWNAFVRMKLMEANEGRAAGDRWKLKDFVKSHAGSLKKTYQKMAPMQKKALREGLSSVRVARANQIRANPRAIRTDADATFKNMTNEWIGICSRLGMQGFFLAVRGSSDHMQEPKMFCTEGAENYIRDILKQEPDNLALKFEAWVINKVDEDPADKRRPKLTGAIQLCRALIQGGLDRILEETGKKRNKKISMNYENYEEKIVEKFSVDLDGWPCPTFGNPGTIGCKNVFKLLAALEDGTCHWVKLSPEALAARKEENQRREANGEQVYKPRKARKVRSARVTAKSAETVEDSEEEPDN